MGEVKKIKTTVPAFEAHVSKAYEAAFDRKPDIYACRVADGVARVQ